MWTFILTDLDGNAHGEVLQATSRSVQLSMSKVSTASFSVRPDNPLMLYLFGDDTLLKVYEGTTLRFYGPVVSVEFATQDTTNAPTIQVNAASTGWRLSRRLAGKDADGDIYTALDKADNAKQIIDTANVTGETGIKTVTVSCGTSGSYTAGPFKTVLDCVGDLAHGIDGFDFYFTPLEGEEPKLNQFDAEAIMGSTKDTIFEYGVGQQNIRSLSYLRDLSNIANSVFHIPDSGLDPTGVNPDPVVHSSDPTSISDHGLYEFVADAYGIEDIDLRTAWVDENVAVLKDARRVVSMAIDIDDGTGRVPQLGTDYWLGDFVTARAVFNDVKMFNGLVRIYQINIELNDNDTATITPILVDDDGNL